MKLMLLGVLTVIIVKMILLALVEYDNDKECNSNDD